MTSASLKMARFVRGWGSGDGESGLESLDAGRAQIPVSGSQTWSVIVVGVAYLQFSGVAGEIANHEHMLPINQGETGYLAVDPRSNFDPRLLVGKQPMEAKSTREALNRRRQRDYYPTFSELPTRWSDNDQYGTCLPNPRYVD